MPLRGGSTSSGAISTTQAFFALALSCNLVLHARICCIPMILWCRRILWSSVAWSCIIRSMVNPLDADLTKNNGGSWNNGGTCNPSGTTCGVHLHAVDSGAFYSGSEGKLGLQSLDSMLVSIGDPLPAPTPLTVPNPLGGVHFSLVDNTWNTNVSEHHPTNCCATP